MGGKSNDNNNSYQRSAAAMGMAPGLTAGPSLSSVSSTHALSPSSSSSQQIPQQASQQGLPTASHHPSTPITHDSPLQYAQGDDRSKRGRYGRSGTTSSNSSSSNESVLFNKAPGKKKEGMLVDDIYTEQDLEHVHPIHRSKIEPSTRQAWGLPVNLDMIELATRLSRMNDDQADEFQSILQHSSHKDAIVEDTEGKSSLF
jgi:hypothetical protein